MLQLRLLGPFEFRRDDGSAVALPGRQSVAILACLALADYFIVARERLAELIWAGRGTEQANGSLRQELVRLRRAIGEEVLPAAGTTAQPVRLDRTLSRSAVAGFSIAPPRSIRRLDRRASPTAAGYRKNTDAAHAAWR